MAKINLHPKAEMGKPREQEVCVFPFWLLTNSGRGLTEDAFVVLILWLPAIRASLGLMGGLRDTGQAHHDVIGVIRLQKSLHLILVDSSTNLCLSRMVLDVHLRGLIVVLHESDLLGSDRNVLHVTLSLRK